MTDDYGPTQIGAVLILAGVAGVGAAVGLIAVGTLAFAGTRALVRATRGRGSIFSGVATVDPPLNLFLPPANGCHVSYPYRTPVSPGDGQ